MAFSFCCIGFVIATSIARAEERAPSTQPAPRTILRVAADPNNLPFSNDKREGFENKLAEMVARDMGVRVEYVWHAQRRGFFRQTLKEGDADVVMGAPAHFDKALTTSPYYRSSYVFVTRKNSGVHVSSFDDPQLRKLKIGVQVASDANTPPAQALGRRGIVDNVVGYTLFGDYTQPNPPARIIDAVARGEVDVAIVWGPLAGYFAKKSSVPLELTPVSPQVDPPMLTMAFDVSVGVKKKDAALRDQIERILVSRHAEIDKLLDEYGVPRVAAPAKTQAAALEHFNPDKSAKSEEVPSCCD